MAREEDWRKVCTTMGDQQGYLLESGVMSDCAFRVVSSLKGDDGQSKEEIFRAHKLLLYRASCVFETMFFGSLPETGGVRVIDIEPEIFNLMLKFIYTDDLPDNLSVEDLMSLCLAANKYLVHNLCQACIAKLESKVDMQNLWKMFDFADTFDSCTLYYAALKVAGENAQQIFNNPKFMEISHKSLVAIANEDNINVTSEMTVIDACLQWAKQECERLNISVDDNNIREVLGEDIISNIRFLTLKPEEFVQGPGAQQWLTSEEKVSVFACLAVPGKVKLHAGLSDNVNQRNNYKKQTSIVPTPFVVPSGPVRTSSMCLQLQRNDQCCSEFGASSMYGLLVTTDKDVYIESVTFYTQIFDSEVTNKFTQSNFIVKGENYAENITFKIGARESNNYNYYNFKATHSSTIKSLIPYNSTITWKIEPPCQVTGNYEVIFSIKTNKIGCYPLCDNLGDEKCSFRFPPFDIHFQALPGDHYSGVPKDPPKSMPIKDITFSW